MAPTPAPPDAGLDPAIRAFMVGGRSVADRIAEAVADGRLIRGDDGHYRLRSDETEAWVLSSDTPTLSTPGTFSAPCHLLNDILFTVVYGEAQVPFGCRACYKIWIRPVTVRALFALKDLLDTTPYSSKIKVEALNPLSPNVYLGIVYGGDLAATRAAYHVLRAAISAAPGLGAEVPMEIRRGCQNYERMCGPSDRYTFDPALEEVEAALAGHFHDSPPSKRSKKQRDAAARLRMVQIAHQLGDESYKDFTGGKPLSISPVRYAPDADDDVQKG